MYVSPPFKQRQSHLNTICPNAKAPVYPKCMVRYMRKVRHLVKWLRIHLLLVSNAARGENDRMAAWDRGSLLGPFLEPWNVTTSSKMYHRIEQTYPYVIYYTAREFNNFSSAILTVD